MSKPASIFNPGDENGTVSVNATSTSSVVTVATNKIIAINATGDVLIAFGNTGGVKWKNAAATTTSFRIPSGTTAQFDLGSKFDSFQLYNPGATTVTAYWMTLVTF
jgi:hypothetical protein